MNTMNDSTGMETNKEITSIPRPNTLGMIASPLFFMILGVFWAVGLLGVLVGLEIFLWFDPGLFRDFDYGSGGGLEGILVSIYDPLWWYCLPIFLVCLLVSAVTAVRFRVGTRGRTVAYLTAIFPILFPILYAILGIMLIFELAIP